MTPTEGSRKVRLPTKELDDAVNLAPASIHACIISDFRLAGQSAFLLMTTEPEQELTWELTGAKIAEQRKAVGLTQAALAKSVGVSQSSVADWEAGRSRPKYLTVIKLASALKLNVNKIYASAMPVKRIDLKSTNSSAEFNAEMFMFLDVHETVEKLLTQFPKAVNAKNIQDDYFGGFELTGKRAALAATYSIWNKVRKAETSVAMSWTAGAECARFEILLHLAEDAAALSDDP